MSEPARPDPDALLEQLRAESQASRRGQLKIFFGFAPGVGKTFAMLEAGRRLAAAGTDVAVGFVETHGRRETASLLEGLEVLPRRAAEHRGLTLEEFDLDRALARKPKVLLVDELAHTNAPGSRHERRFQDVLELLDAGIDVHTTLNVQHVESLNDVVRRLTGVTVRETVPDSVLDRADDLELIDLPPDELLGRLAEGKVYVPDQAARATSHFFRRENLVGLRELALRRTAERVDVELSRLREQRVVSSGATERVLVGVGPAPSSADVVRSARRLADALHAPWTVVWVEHALGVPLGAEDSERLDGHLRLAESLGATVLRLEGRELTSALVDAAKKIGAQHVVLGAPKRASRPLDALLGAGLQVHVVPTAAPQATAAPSSMTSGAIDWLGLGAATGAIATVTAIGVALRGTLSLQDQVILFLLAIMAVSARFSRTASFTAAALAVAAYDFFFVPPLFTFSVSDATHVLTFAMMFVVGVVISSLTLRLRRQERASRERERRTAALYALSRDVAQTASTEELANALARHASELFGCDAGVVLNPNFAAMTLHTSSPRLSLGTSERAVVRWVLDHGRAAGLGTETLPGAPVVCFPISIEERSLGGLVLLPDGPLPPSVREFVGAFVQPAVLALERVRLTADAQRALVQAKSEQLRATLLSTVSHDLRTPLAAITGAASTLRDPSLRLAALERDELLLTVEQESARLERLIANLLEMTRLETGTVELRRSWVPLSELVASATQGLETTLGTRPLTTSPNETLLEVDPVLFERVLANLIENAARHTPDGTTIEVSSKREEGSVVLEVADRGPGIDASVLPTIFERFVRGRSSAGTGLGLAIVRSVVTLHGGTVRASNREGGGASFIITLPQRAPPP